MAKKELSAEEAIIEALKFQVLEKYFDEESEAFDVYKCVTGILEEYKIIYADGMGFYIFNGKYWERIGDVFVSNIILEELGPLYIPKYVRDTMDGLRSKKPIKMEDLNRNRNRIVLSNGTLDISDREKHIFYEDEFFKEDYATIRIGCNYDPDAQYPMFQKYINEVLNDDPELIQLMQEFFGYCLTTSTKYEKAFILLGEGSTGKSVLIDTLKELICEQNYSCVPLSQLNDDKYTAQLKDKLLNYSTEEEDKPIKDVSKFKQLVSGDQIQARFLYSNPITYKPFAKLIFAMNTLPEMSNFDGAIQRRLVIIPFNRKFEDHEKDFELKEGKLYKELDGILNWALEGLKSLASRDKSANQGFIMPKVCQDLLSQYKNDCNPIDQFLNDNVIVEVGSDIISSGLYEAYREFCKSIGINADSDQKFAKMVKSKYMVEKLRKTFPNKGQQYYYPNLKIIDNKATNVISLGSKRNSNTKNRDENNYSSKSTMTEQKRFPSSSSENKTEINIDRLLDEVF